MRAHGASASISCVVSSSRRRRAWRLRSPGGPLSSLLRDRAAHLRIDPKELVAYLRQLGDAKSKDRRWQDRPL